MRLSGKNTWGGDRGHGRGIESGMEGGLQDPPSPKFVFTENLVEPQAGYNT